MSSHTLPALTDVQLPGEGRWAAFREGGHIYVLRADTDGSWTLLGRSGETLGTLRRSRERYRAYGVDEPGPPQEDWREVVRRLASRTAAPPPRPR